MKPQDVLIALSLAIEPPGARPTLAQIGRRLGLSLGEVHGAVRRASRAGLLGPDRTPNRASLREFLLHGLKYVFPATRGGLMRGVPTAHAAAPLSAEIGDDGAPPPVWPDAEGTVRGESFEPLYPSVPLAARNDPKLYQALCLIDALRGGRARERALAAQHLERMLA